MTPDPGAQLRRRRPPHRSRGDPADGRDARRSRSRHRERSEERRAASPRSAACKIDIAYGGSCTAGKRDDIDMYARVMADAETRRQARRRRRAVLHPVRLAGSRALRARARLHRAVRAHRRRGDQARLRRVHRLRARRVASAATRSRCRRSTATTRAAPGPASCTSRRRSPSRPRRSTGEIVEYDDGMFAKKK